MNRWWMITIIGILFGLILLIIGFIMILPIILITIGLSLIMILFLPIWFPLIIGIILIAIGILILSKYKKKL